MDYSLFDTLIDAVLVVDEARTIVYRNESLAVLCDLPIRRIKLGTKSTEVLTFDDPTLPIMSQGEWGTREASRYREILLTSASGKEARVQVSFQPDLSISAPGGNWIFYIRDVTLEAALHKKYRLELSEKEVALEKLADYAQNLERKVEERTAELNSMNRLLSAILESLGQGFLIFDGAQKVLPVFSRACERLLESSPRDRSIAQVLGISALPEKGRQEFELWVKSLFSEPIPFESLVALGPESFPHSQGRAIALEYHAMRSEAGAVSGVVVVATDKTDERAARLEALRERAYVVRITRLIRSKDLFLAYYRETMRLLENIRTEIVLGEALRWFHTIKGGALTFEIGEVRDLAHQCEGLLEELAAGHPCEGELREKILTSVEDIALALDRFFSEHAQIIGRAARETEYRVEIPFKRLADFRKSLVGFPAPLESSFVDSFMLEPSRGFFTHLDDLLSTLAAEQGKEIAPVVLQGGETAVLRERFADLFGSLIHAFTNIIEHGLEPPSERIACGKPLQGKVTLTFSQGEGPKGEPTYKICIEDDGRGISVAKLREKLRSQSGTESDAESDDQILQHVFDPGLSTRDAVTKLAGRGVGMDAIQASALALGGGAQIQSVLGKGTVLEIWAPLAAT